MEKMPQDLEKMQIITIKCDKYKIYNTSVQAFGKTKNTFFGFEKWFCHLVKLFQFIIKNRNNRKPISRNFQQNYVKKYGKIQKMWIMLELVKNAIMIF